jgi:hypothetical protein
MMLDDTSSMTSRSEKTPKKLEKIDQKTSLKLTTKTIQLIFPAIFHRKSKNEKCGKKSRKNEKRE